LRKAERRKLELLLQFLVRETSGKGREQIASLCQLIPEWRQGLLHLGKGCFLCSHVQPGNITELELSAQLVEHLRLDLDNADRCGNLRAQRSLLDGCCHHV